MEIVAFSGEMLEEAAGLLANQQQRGRMAVPELSKRYENKNTAKNLLAGLWLKNNCEGFAAVHQGKLAAYLIGQRLLDNPFRGRCGWVESGGCAYDPEQGLEVVRDLYAALGHWWVSQGIFNHIVMVTVADDQFLQAWYSLSFGIEQVHGLANLGQMQPATPPLPPGIALRRATAEDGPDLAQLSEIIWRVQVEAPVWGVMLPETVAETAEAWADLGKDDEARVWLAFLDGEAVGMQAYWPVGEEEQKLFLPPQCLHLSVGATRPEARGRGVGTLLTQSGLADAYQEGFQFCEVDWRSTNLMASRFWPRRGFRPVVYRLVRRVDERIAWAKGTKGIDIDG